MFESSERGYLLLNGKPMSLDALARNLGLDKQILSTSLTTLLTSGVCHRRESDGALYSKRMVRDEGIRLKRSNAGSRGGNPVLLKQNSSKSKNKGYPSSKQNIEYEYEYENEDEYYNNKKLPPLELPENWRSPELQTAVLNWQKKLKKDSNGRRELDQIQLDALCMKFGSSRALLAALRHTLTLSHSLNVYAPKIDAQAASISGAVNANMQILNDLEREIEEENIL
jgi:hypothetical protein